MDAPDIYRSIFDALPALIFVVDEDVRIYECNAAAEELIGAQRSNFVKQRAGEILHCLHAHEAPEGCGRAEFCKNCIIRNAVQEAFQGSRSVRRRAHLEIVHQGEVREIFAFITASPFLYKDSCIVLLVIEDINELAELKRIITMCSLCRKVRDEEKSWIRIEAYFNDQWGVDFSHGLCPECHRKEMEKLEAYIRANNRQPE